MTTGKLFVRLDLRWWVAPYVHALTFVAFAMCCRPDVDRVVRFIAKRGVKITLGTFKS